MTAVSLLTFVAIGIGAGILAGFFGVGGGLIVVPMLIFIVGYSQPAATGTSLVALLGPTGIMGVIAYYQAGRISSVEIKAGFIIALGMFFGTYAGSKIALQLSTDTLRKGFAIFLVVVAVRLWLQASKAG